MHMHAGKPVAGSAGMSMTIRLGCAAALIIGALGVARAEAPGAAPPPSKAPDPPGLDLHRWEDHPIGAELVVGLGAPTGLLGVMLDWTPVRWLSLEGGGGIDRSVQLFNLGQGGSALQASAMARGRLANGRWGLSAGLGLSVGSYQECDGCPFEAGDIRTWSRAVWRNVELAMEHRWASGVGLVVHLGEARMLNPGAVSCEPHVFNSGCAPRSSVYNPYIGIAIHIPLWTSSRPRAEPARDQRSPPNARLWTPR